MGDRILMARFKQPPPLYIVFSLVKIRYLDNNWRGVKSMVRNQDLWMTYRFHEMPFLVPPKALEVYSWLYKFTIQWSRRTYKFQSVGTRLNRTTVWWINHALAEIQRSCTINNLNDIITASTRLLHWSYLVRRSKSRLPSMLSSKNRIFGRHCFQPRSCDLKHGLCASLFRRDEMTGDKSLGS